MRRITRTLQRDDRHGKLTALQQETHGVSEKSGDLFFVSGLHEVESGAGAFLAQEVRIITGGQMQ